MTSKKKKAGQQKRGLSAISESSESQRTEVPSSSLSSPCPRSTATSDSTLSLPSSSHQTSSNIRPSCEVRSRSGFQTQSRAVPQAHPRSHQALSHPTSSARPASSSSSLISKPHPPPSSSSTQPCAACCTAPCCTGAKSSSSCSRSRGPRSVSPNPLLPSIPPPSRRKTMTKKKSGTSSRQKTKAGADVMARLVDPKIEKNVRAMESPPEDWVGWTFPLPLRPLLDSPALEVIRVVFKDKGQLYLMMKKFIDAAKNGATRVHIIIFKSVPLDVIKDDMVWDYNIAPHCRFFYLEAQATLIMKIATETRMTEFFPMTKLKFDDTNMGVQGHALGRFKYGLKKQLSTMGIADNRWEFACSKTRHSHGVIFDNNDTVQIKSIHSADRIFIPDINRHTKFDAEHQPWPTMVIETGSDCANIASRFYLEYSADWWFTQSEGFTKIVIVMMFDYAHHATVIEKWVCAPEAPYTKKLAQTITVFPKPNDKGKPSVIVQGEDLILEIESLMARPKREGESDIVFDKEFMKGFGNGFLLPWRNLGAKRENNLKSSGIDVATARKLLNYPLASLKQQLGPALAEALKMAEKAAKAVGADADVGASKMTLTLTRNKVSEKGKEKAVEEESSFGEDWIAVDITIGEAIAIMAEKEVVEEEK